MKKGPTGRWVWFDILTLLAGLVIILSRYLIYKVVCGVKAHVFDYRHYGDVPPFIGDVGSRGLSKQARQFRYQGMLEYYAISGDSNPTVLKYLGPELAKRVKLVALPYAAILDYVRQRLILPPSRVSINIVTRGTPITANVCYATYDDYYYVLYDPKSEYSEFYLLHELGHVKDNLENGEWMANKFAIDQSGGYDEMKDISSCTTDLLDWCEHISGIKLSKFEKKVLTDFIFIRSVSKVECFKQYASTKDVEYLKTAESLE